MTEADRSLPCLYPLTNMYVAPDGAVYNCCSTNSESLGNPPQQSAAEPWNGVPYQQDRRRVAAGVPRAHCAIRLLKRSGQGLVSRGWAGLGAGTLSRACGAGVQHSIQGWRRLTACLGSYPYATVMLSSLLEIRRYLKAPGGGRPLGTLAFAGRWSGHARAAGRAPEMYAAWRLGSNSLLSTLFYAARKARQRADERLRRLPWTARRKTRF